MALPLPVFQKFDCHGCGYCCRNLVVNVTPVEQKKILEAGWRDRLAGQTLFIPYRFGSRRLIRLAHRTDGACVFLGEDGRCRIHAESGLSAKPLACRLYPFVPTPGVGSVRVDLRGDCPSVAANKGRPLTAHRAEILALARETGTEFALRAPAWNGVHLEPPEFQALVDAFETCLSAATLSPRGRLQAAGLLYDLLCDVRVARVRGEAFLELMPLVAESAIAEAREATQERRAGGRVQRLFRQWLFLHALADDPEELAIGRIERLRRSWHRYGQSRRFAAGTGVVPALRPDWPATTFEQVDAVGRAEEESLEPLIRSMRVKLDAHAFAGPAYFGAELLAGLGAWLLLPCVAGWLARMEAVRHGRGALSAEDVLTGVTNAHHTFGVSPVFSKISERLRLRALAQTGVGRSLMAQYGP